MDRFHPATYCKIVRRPTAAGSTASQTKRWAFHSSASRTMPIAIRLNAMLGCIGAYSG